MKKCKLCEKRRKGFKPLKLTKEMETVRVKGDLFGQPLDEVFHTDCWLRQKIYY